MPYQYPDVIESAPNFDPNSGYYYDMPEAPVYTQPAKPGTSVGTPVGYGATPNYRPYIRTLVPGVNALSSYLLDNTD